ncbi:hypothetical protein MMC14_000804 [Varicellaria rhodocarpa]|nr:hypothetical protein [Varicellaria rhodocarpa]
MVFLDKPTFVCLHGAWHSPACFNDLSVVLAAYDYTCVCPALPFTGSNPPTYDFTEDVDTIRSVVTELVEKEQDVIVLMHSYSGIPGGQALENLDKKSC